MRLLPLLQRVVAHAAAAERADAAVGLGGEAAEAEEKMALFGLIQLKAIVASQREPLARWGGEAAAALLARFLARSGRLLLAANCRSSLPSRITSRGSASR